MSASAGPDDAWPRADGVRIDRDGAVLRIVLDRPATLNALDAAMVEAVAAALERVRRSPAVRTVVISGEGRAFSSGARLVGDDPAAGFPADAVTRANRMIRAVVDLDRPVVAIVDGVAAGVGLALALACDLQVVTTRSSLALTFTGIGLMPDGGTTATVTAAVGRARAMRMTLLGEALTGTEAHAAGLVSHLCEPDGLADEVERVVRRLAGAAPLALAATKRAVNAAAIGALEDALAREERGQGALLRTDDASEGMRAFAERRRPRFEGR